jgi:hypothetical protein
MNLPTRVVKVSSLVLDREYRIVRAERVGERPLISFSGVSPDYISQVFLPHSVIYTDEDLRVISSEDGFYILVYRGRIGRSEFHMVDVLRDM